MPGNVFHSPTGSCGLIKCGINTSFFNTPCVSDIGSLGTAIWLEIVLINANISQPLTKGFIYFPGFGKILIICWTF